MNYNYDFSIVQEYYQKKRAQRTKKGRTKKKQIRICKGKEDDRIVSLWKTVRNVHDKWHYYELREGKKKKNKKKITFLSVFADLSLAT